MDGCCPCLRGSRNESLSAAAKMSVRMYVCVCFILKKTTATTSRSSRDGENAECIASGGGGGGGDGIVSIGAYLIAASELR